MAKKSPKTASEAKTAKFFACKDCGKDVAASTDPRDGGLPTSWSKDDDGNFRCFKDTCRNVLKVSPGQTIVWAVPEGQEDRYLADGWSRASERLTAHYLDGVPDKWKTGHVVLQRPAA